MTPDDEGGVVLVAYILVALVTCLVSVAVLVWLEFGFSSLVYGAAISILAVIAFALILFL